MATFYLFNEFSKSSADGRIDLDTDTLKLALVSAVPNQTDAVPTWGAGGTTNLSTNEVSGTGYTAGGETLASVTFNHVTGTTTLDAADVVFSQNAGGPANIEAAILYSDTAANKDAIGYIDFEGTQSMVAGDVTAEWNASGILRFVRA